MDDAVAVKFTSRDILDKLLHLKSFIQEKLPYAEVTISTPTLTLVNGKVALTLRELTDLLINLKTVILDNGNIKTFKLNGSPFKSDSNLLNKNVISKLRYCENLWNT